MVLQELDEWTKFCDTFSQGNLCKSNVFYSPGPGFSSTSPDIIRDAVIYKNYLNLLFRKVNIRNAVM